MGPVNRRLVGLALLVAAGAAVGTAIRATLEEVFPAQPGQWPQTTFLINITGSLLLGILLESLALSGDDIGWRQRLRLTAGTGVLGGFTTYSSFVVEIDQLARSGHLLIGASYALISIVLGVVAAGAGVYLVGAVHRRSAGRGSH